MLKANIVNLPGVRLLYRDSGGNGPAIIFLHANTGTSQSWEPQFAYFISGGFRVIAFDRRGRGGSVPAPESGEQPGSVSEDLSSLVEHLKLQHFILVGVAGGGFQALDYAAWKPEQLRGLVIVASNGSISEPQLINATEQLRMPFIDNTNRYFLEVSPTYRLMDPAGLDRWLKLEEHAHAQNAPIQPLRTPNTFGKLASIKCPTLVISGCADLLAPPALMKMWASHVPNAEFHEFSSAGHALPWEQPARFNKLLSTFLTTLTE